MTFRATSVLRVLLVATLLYGSGAHWLLVQGAAWAGMVAARTGRNTVAQALTTTFDGRHPCRVCLIVKRGAAPAPAASVAPTVDFAFVAVPAIAPSVAVIVPLAGAASSFASAFRAPPSPPPNILPVA